MIAAATQDMQVHSTFSDGADTIEANVAEAEAFGLVELCCVDHVRRDTAWLPEYTAAVAALETETPLTLHCGIEAKLLDTAGTLDMPDGPLDGVSWIYAADHQVPMADGVHHPDEVREGIESGRYRAEEVVAGLLQATESCLPQHPGRIVIAHIFSILPKIGVREEDVPLQLIESLAQTTYDTGNRIEVNERYRTPSAATLAPFVARGVPLLMSTDSHRRDTIGRYDHCLRVVRELSEAAAR
ncbi:PHP domain-containing protein [Conexibacter sp. JD483]|uniref:PHP domain-containing protein n=1 Tax=unclassified Conexibacter TaxID=2627773 RepID=UPI00271B96CD|nr:MULTISPECIES: PHP domain-containing protein [unclassified Conexibacter]MDO8184993.1 PHP domain-containing protein [Conexibacter sp. CPCC 205706]MDO8198137.1 PHP domain-containing protein [Conexibacter sp. CPCC 205762]MDR9368241.1 PHP domain-containing protein [Conexibacter sp. JD483]